LHDFLGGAAQGPFLDAALFVGQWVAKRSNLNIHLARNQRLSSEIRAWAPNHLAF